MVPGLAHVDQILAQVRNSGVRVTLEVSGQPARLDASVDLAAYRLIQEGITNVTKHCGTGAQVAVTVEWGAEKVTVAVEDDGLGVRSAVPAGGGGHGLAGLRERIAIAAGEFSAGPTESGGFRVAARLPVSTGSPIPPPAKASRPVEEHLGVDR
jgi:signal transduction histidine kinase